MKRAKYNILGICFNNYLTHIFKFITKSCNNYAGLHFVIDVRKCNENFKKTGLPISMQNLTLCVPCIVLQCVNDQRDAQFL